MQLILWSLQIRERFCFEKQAKFASFTGNPLFTTFTKCNYIKDLNCIKCASFDSNKALFRIQSNRPKLNRKSLYSIIKTTVLQAFTDYWIVFLRMDRLCCKRIYRYGDQRSSKGKSPYLKGHYSEVLYFK